MVSKESNPVDVFPILLKNQILTPVNLECIFLQKLFTHINLILTEREPISACNSKKYGFI